jgi:hypothetical protein
MMHGRIAKIDAERRRSMLLLQRSQSLTRQGEGFFPFDFVPLVTAPLHRTLQAVGVGFQIEDGIALRADVTTTEGIVAITAYANERVALVLEFETADGFAQRTRAEA